MLRTQGQGEPVKYATKKICRTCEQEKGGKVCQGCKWPEGRKYPTEYLGPKLKTTKGLDEVTTATI